MSEAEGCSHSRHCCCYQNLTSGAQLYWVSSKFLSEERVLVDPEATPTS